jgi:hypothetical protein
LKAARMGGFFILNCSMLKWVFVVCFVFAALHGSATSIFNFQIDSPSFNTKLHADSILADNIIPMDDEATFACMDSLMSVNPETRNFYFKVMRVIVSKSDGALSEMVGVKLKKYLELFAYEFFENYKTLLNIEKESFVSFIGREFYLSEGNGDEAFKNTTDYFDGLANMYPQCKKFQKEIDKAKKAIFKIISQLTAEQ